MPAAKASFRLRRYLSASNERRSFFGRSFFLGFRSAAAAMSASTPPTMLTLAGVCELRPVPTLVVSRTVTSTSPMLIVARNPPARKAPRRLAGRLVRRAAITTTIRIGHTIDANASRKYSVQDTRAIPAHGPVGGRANSSPSDDAWARSTDFASVMTMSKPLGRGRRITVWVLLVLATIISVVSILTVYVKRQLLDNGSWTNASAKVIADPEVQDALSIYLTNQLYQNVDVTTAIEQRLPTNLKPLASPLCRG